MLWAEEDVIRAEKLVENRAKIMNSEGGGYVSAKQGTDVGLGNNKQENRLTKYKRSIPTKYKKCLFNNLRPR